MVLRSQTKTAAPVANLPKPQKRTFPTESEDFASCRKRPKLADPPSSVGPRRADLTVANLDRHTRQVSPEMPEKKRSSRGTSISTSRTKTSDPHFGQALTKNGVIHEPLYTRRPTDWSDIKKDLEQSRASGSPTSEDHRNHMYKVLCSENETTLVARAFGTLAKEYGPNPDMRYYPTMNQEWTEVDENNVTANLSRPKPDFSEALAIQSYPDKAVEDLGSALRPTAYDSAMPRFAVEMKRRGLGQGAQHQSAYDGAIMVQAARAQSEYLGEIPCDMNTEALTATYNGRVLDLYANHAVRSARGLQYHQTLISHHILESTREDFSRGRKHLRNAQDWAHKKTIDTCKKFAQKDAHGHSPPSPPATNEALLVPEEPLIAPDSQTNPKRSQRKTRSK